MNETSLLDNEAFNAYLKKCLEELPDRWLTLVKLTYLQEKNQQKFVRKPMFLRLIIGKYYNAADSSFGSVYNLTGSEKENEHLKENITCPDTALQ